MTDQNAIAILVCYGVDECPPCRAMHDSLKIVAKGFGGSLEINYVDAWENHESIVRLGILSLPSAVLYLNGELRLRLAGFHWPDQLAEKIVAALDDIGNFQLSPGLKRPHPIKRLTRMFWPRSWWGSTRSKSH